MTNDDTPDTPLDKARRLENTAEAVIGFAGALWTVAATVLTLSRLVAGCVDTDSTFSVFMRSNYAALMLSITAAMAAAMVYGHVKRDMAVHLLLWETKRQEAILKGLDDKYDNPVVQVTNTEDWETRLEFRYRGDVVVLYLSKDDDDHTFKKLGMTLQCTRDAYSPDEVYSGDQYVASVFDYSSSDYGSLDKFKKSFKTMTVDCSTCETMRALLMAFPESGNCMQECHSSARCRVTVERTSSAIKAFFGDVDEFEVMFDGDEEEPNSKSDDSDDDDTKPSDEKFSFD